jgi:enoyl-CoA hydratase/carnithine racemase
MMSFAALDELDGLLQRIEADSLITAVVLASALSDYFVAHADVEDVMRMERGLPPVGDSGAGTG